MEQGRRSLEFLKSLGNQVPGRLRQVINNPIKPNKDESKVIDEGKAVSHEHPSKPEFAG